MVKCPKPKEHDVQKAIVQALRAAGFHVYETTAYRQKGPSGVDRGVPDLLVSHPLIRGYFVGLEVKRDEKAPLSLEQKAAVEAERYVISTDPGHALKHCLERLLWGTCHMSDPRADGEYHERQAARDKAKAIVDQLVSRRAA